MKLQYIIWLAAILVSSPSFGFTTAGSCVVGKFVKTCVGDNIYVLENRNDYDLDEEEALVFVKVDQMVVTSVNVSRIEAKPKLSFGGRKESYLPEQIIVRQGCVYKNRYCIDEQVYIPGYNIRPIGKIVGIFMDGRVLVERLNEKTMMNTRDLVRLREE